MVPGGKSDDDLLRTTPDCSSWWDHKIWGTDVLHLHVGGDNAKKRKDVNVNIFIFEDFLWCLLCVCVCVVLLLINCPQSNVSKCESRG